MCAGKGVREPAVVNSSSTRETAMSVTLPGRSTSSAAVTLKILGVTGAVIAGNSLLFGSRLFFDPRPFSEVGGSFEQRAYHLLLLFCLGVLAVTLPRLVSVRGRDGAHVPAALAVATGLAAFYDGGTRFVEAFVVPYLANHAPALLDESPSSGLMIAMMAAWFLTMGTVLALAVVAYRRRVFPRAACVLLAVGAVSVPVLGPLAGILLGSAYAWAGFATLRRTSLVETSAPMPSAAAAALR